MSRPTSRLQRSAADARRLAALQAARAAAVSRRRLAARRRLILVLLLTAASISGWVAVSAVSLSVAAAIVPTVLLAGVLLLGRRAAKAGARRDEADRAAIAELSRRTAGGRPAAPRPASARPPVSRAGQSRSPETQQAGRHPSAGSTGQHGAVSVIASPAADQAPDDGVRAADDEPTEPTAPVAQQRDAAAEPADDDRRDVADQPASDLPVTASEPAAVTTIDDRTAVTAEERPWTPVPVPAPSYALKPAAPRRDIAGYEASGAASQVDPREIAIDASPYAPSRETAGQPGGTAQAEAVTQPAASTQDDGAGQPGDAPQPPRAAGLDLDSALARRRAVGA